MSEFDKAILYPRNQLNGSKICTRPREMLGKQRVSQNVCFCSGPSFLAKYSYEKEEKLFANFLTGYSFKGRRNLKNLRHSLVA